MKQQNGIDTGDCGLKAPFNPSDGILGTGEETKPTLQSLAMADAISYLLVELSVSEIKQALVVRHAGLNFAQALEIIEQARPLVESEKARQRKVAVESEQAKTDFDKLAALFDGPILTKTGSGYVLSNLTEAEIKMLAAALR